MKINDSHIDENTRKLFQKTDLDSPSKTFTYDVMKNLEKEKVYGKNLPDYLWQVILAVGLPVLYFLFQYLTNGSEAFSKIIIGIKTSQYLDFINVISEKILEDVSLSPLVFMGIIAILLLLAFDRIILKMLHSYK
jgi:hypothetical protein